MKKNYLIVLFALFTFALNVHAQENETGQEETYNMVVKMPDGTTVTISTDDVDEVSFSNGELVLSGESLKEILNQYRESIQSEVDEMRSLLDLLRNQINGDEGILIVLTNLIANDAAQDALIATLQCEIANLKTWIDKIDQWSNENNNNIADVMTWLNTLQTELTKDQADIQATMDKAVHAQVDAVAAKQMADLAYAMAQNAQDIGNTAKNTADVANDAAQKSFDLATIAQNVANEAKSISDQALAKTYELEAYNRSLKETMDCQEMKINEQMALIEELMAEIQKMKDEIEALKQK